MVKAEGRNTCDSFSGRLGQCAHATLKRNVLLSAQQCTMSPHSRTLATRHQLRKKFGPPHRLPLPCRLLLGLTNGVMLAVRTTVRESCGDEHVFEGMTYLAGKATIREARGSLRRCS